MRCFLPLRALAGLALGVLLVAGAAEAQSKTAAGTTVENTFTLDYSVGGFAQPTIDNTATPTVFSVDRLVNLTVVSLDPAPNVSPNSTGNQIRFRVTNLGNDIQAYDLSFAYLGTPDFTPANVAITYFIDLNANDVFDGAEVLETYTLGTPTVDLEPDQHIVVIVTYDVPAGTSDGSEADFVLTADTLFGTTSFDPLCTPVICDPGTAVVADTGGNTLGGPAENVLADGAGVTDAANAGDFSASSDITVLAPVLAAAKTVTMMATAPASDAACSALTSPEPGDQYGTPGGCILYTISVTNTGTGAASNLVVSDRLPAEVRFLAASLATSTATGFADDPGIPGSGPVLSAPAAAEDCNGTTNCLIELTDAILAGAENGQVRIWARVR